MASLGDRLRKLTENSQQEQPSLQLPTQKKKLTQDNKEIPAEKPTEPKAKSKKIEVPKASKVITELKTEADNMEHSMVSQLCNNLSKFLFELLIYPLELLDAWIVCMTLDKEFKQRAQGARLIFIAVALAISVLVLLVEKSATALIATAIFSVAVLLLGGKK